MNDEVQELIEIVVVLTEKDQLKNNPFKALPKESLELALKTIYESSEELTGRLSDLPPR